MTASLGLTPEQRELRKQGIGGSEIAAIAGLDPYRNALDVYLEKTGQVESPTENQFMRWGKRLEAVIADEYAEQTGNTVVSCDTTVHQTNPWMLCTPDRLVFVHGTEGAQGGLECKSRGVRQADRWGESGTDEVPHDVAAQCHWCMAVTGLPWWDVAVLIGGNEFRTYRLLRDEDLERGLIEIGRRFWFEHVVAGVHPPLDGSASAHRFVFKKYPMHSDEMVEDAPPEIADAATLLAVHHQAIARHEAEASKLEVQLKDFIGSRLGVAFPNGKITWKYMGAVEVKAHTRKASRRLLVQVKVPEKSK